MGPAANQILQTLAGHRDAIRGYGARDAILRETIYFYFVRLTLLAEALCCRRGAALCNAVLALQDFLLTCRRDLVGEVDLVSETDSS
jgi:hypothetical protein